MAERLNTKTMGDISEAMIVAALLRSGRIVLRPIGDNQRYDLVLDDNGVFVRVQCKTGRLANGVIEFTTSSSYHHRGRPRRGYLGEAELFGVYCPGTGQCYLVPVKECGSSSAKLRIKATSNGQQVKVRMASDFLI